MQAGCPLTQNPVLSNSTKQNPVAEQAPALSLAATALLVPGIHLCCLVLASLSPGPPEFPAGKAQGSLATVTQTVDKLRWLYHGRCHLSRSGTSWHRCSRAAWGRGPAAPPLTPGAGPAVPSPPAARFCGKHSGCPAASRLAQGGDPARALPQAPRGGEGRARRKSAGRPTGAARPPRLCPPRPRVLSTPSSPPRRSRSAAASPGLPGGPRALPARSGAGPGGAASSASLRPAAGPGAWGRAGARAGGAAPGPPGCTPSPAAAGGAQPPEPAAAAAARRRGQRAPHSNLPRKDSLRPTMHRGGQPLKKRRGSFKMAELDQLPDESE